MTYEVHVKGVSRLIRVGAQTTILDAALEAGIAYPHGCKSGRCGACKSRLVSGEVELLKHTPFSLTTQERQAGLILACRAQPRANSSVAWLPPDGAEHPICDVVARVLTIERATHDIKRIRLRADAKEPIEFSAGQYAELTFEGCPPRHYSMANPPGSHDLEFHIRAVPGGAASGFAVSRLAVGDRVRLRGPFGHSHLRVGHSGPIIAIAGGSGLAPITSIVRTAIAEGLRQPIKVYFGARAERDVYGESWFAHLASANSNLTFMPVLSAEPATRRRAGLVTDAVAADWSEFRGWKAYLAGPPAMVDAASDLLLSRGLAPCDLHADAFFTTSEQSAEQELDLVAGGQG